MNKQEGEVEGEGENENKTHDREHRSTRAYRLPSSGCVIHFEPVKGGHVWWRRFESLEVGSVPFLTGSHEGMLKGIKWL